MIEAANRIEFHKALMMVWEYIGSEIIRDHEEIEHIKFVSRRDVVDAVCFPGRMATFGGLDNSLITIWEDLEWIEKEEVAREAFPEPEYII